MVAQTDNQKRLVPGVPTSSALAGVILAFGIMVGLATIWLRVSFSEFQDLVLYLVASSILSGFVGYGVFRWTESGRRSIRSKILIAYGLGVVIVLINILVTAQLMFLSSHDLGLLMVLLVFGAVLSVTFGATLASQMTGVVHQLVEGARRVSSGDLQARVDVRANDELGDLANSFNAMVANVNQSEDMRRRAEEARRDLVAAVSHDLRTPLTAIQAMLEALSDGLVDDPETVHRYHQTMSSQVTHLSRLIDDLFELSLLDASPHPYQLRRADLEAVVRESIEGTAMSAKQQGIALVLNAEGPYYCNLEPTKITRVIGNLVENALRQAPEHSTITISITPANTAVVVSVRDQGSGIDEEHLGLIFDRFYRGEKSRSRTHGGAGLGLSIAQGIIEAHGGDIWAENAVDCGARFSFSLPVDPDSGFGSNGLIG